MPVLQFYLISPPALKEDLVSMARKGDGPRMRWCGLIGNRSGVFVQASPITLKGVRHRSPIATQGSHIGRSCRPRVRSGNRSVTAHALSLKPFPDLGSLCPLLSIQQSGLVTRNHQGAQAPALRYSWRFLCPAVSFYGGCAWGASVRAGFLDSRLTNPRTVATHSFGHVVWRLQ